jgi:hypothetical protein
VKAALRERFESVHISPISPTPAGEIDLVRGTVTITARRATPPLGTPRPRLAASSEGKASFAPPCLDAGAPLCDSRRSSSLLVADKQLVQF